MSKLTFEHLNNLILVGFTDKRGRAWSYREGSQGSEPNHYPLAVPLEDVRRRLINFDVLEKPIYIRNDEGVFIPVADRKAMVASDNLDVLGIFKDGYQGHQYDEWLVKYVENLLDADLSVGSAGFTRADRSRMFVQIEMEETMKLVEFDVSYRPFLMAATSFDGSLATTYKQGVTRAVCDNTEEAVLQEDGNKFKVKHTRYSKSKIGTAREALGLIYKNAEAFEAEVKALCNTDVTGDQWQKALDILVPIPEKKGRGQTMAETKRGDLNTLYFTDARVAPWSGTAYGVVQAFNTWNQHYATVRNSSRSLRSVDNFISGKVAAQDAEVMQVIGELVGA